MKKIATLAIFAFAISLLSAQRPAEQIALRYLQQEADRWSLLPTDLADLVVTDQYTSPLNGVTHVYLAQRWHGIPVFLAQAGIHLQEDQVRYATCPFIPQLAERINAETPVLTPYEAVLQAAAATGLHITRPLTLLESTPKHALFSKGDLTQADIPVDLVYYQAPGQYELRLAWNLALAPLGSSDLWSIRVDALTGTVLDQQNWTRYCRFPAEPFAPSHDHSCSPTEPHPTSPAPLAAFNGTGTYHVFPLPVESPIHGNRQVVTDPADPLASPFGWHDTDGQVGPEYTITRGNNVHAYLDVENANFSQGDEPDGGAELLFDFYFDINDEPQHMRDASVTQMFYLNNMMHDFSYRYGFDEAAGNFQQLNYSGEGIGNDYVLAEAQDGSQYNNANFGTPPDGSPGRMQMFLWNPPGGQLLTIESPNTISGPYNTGFATYGPAVNATPITAPIIDVNDGSSIPTHGCLPLVNSDEVSGKIAMVDRGGCYFDEKTFIAQQAGAVAVIICNHQEGFLLINPSPVNLPPINIPTISLGASDCATIRLQLAAGEEVIGSIVQPNEGGPSAVSGDFDNGIMSHEYAHGISARLTGGPSNVDCLFNDEQMGEGWSDFFALATTTPPGLDGATPRGIGNYTARKLPDAGGVRRLPYTTDWAINSQTYDDIIGTTSYQQLGEVWAGALWDIYWAFVDTYEFDEDFIHGDGGNNMAIQLVIDAMKLQACSPGFIDGRDAILMADSLAYDGIHQCLLWEVFARRGLGYQAQQNSRYNRNDGFQDFTVKPSCITELKVAKSVDRPLILPGDDVTVFLTVTNDKLEDATNVVVTDQLPDGLTYLPGSVQGVDVAVTGNTLTFGLGDLIPGEVRTFQYQV
ncbi:MAG: M36 family metallopeptidase, partial [Lewinella sp.]|nr:M36 family metallopeptidase [Lewinella sp.]